MLNWTEADKPYVEALVALEVASRTLLALQLRREGVYLGAPIWESLRVVATTLHVAWTANRLVRLRADMAMRRA